MDDRIPESRIPAYLQYLQQASFIALLVFTPLARGASPRWAFCIALWLGLLSFLSMVEKRILQGKGPLPRTALEMPVALLVLLAAVSWAFSIYREATNWAFLRLLLYIGVFYLTVDIMPSRHLTRRLVVVIVAIAMMISLLGIVEYSGAPFPDFWKTQVSMGIESTYLNHNHLGGYLAMAFALGLGVFLHRPLGSALIWAISLLVILVALCLSLSRGAWIGSFVAVELMLTLFLLRRGVTRLKTAAVTLGLFVTVGLILLASNPMIDRMQTLHALNAESSWTSRLAVWKQCAQIIEESPILGTGMGTFPWSFTRVRPAGLTARYHEAHNDYVQIVTEMGLPVLIPLLWGIMLVFRMGIRAYRDTPSRLRAGVTLGALGGITAILVHSVSDFNIQITANGIVFGCLVGMVGSTRFRE